ncbi:glycogen debranching N-terminal domain-containing protein [Streptomyces sp. Ru87]|uniref:amylo-alpha-1,6-glucosidase n=1 Tax=Streptomyces sp. Ru87 TaxID=2044307 RepID=UPI000BF76931|nr:glycogen debranching N-terminal domain-containing protein [Streptomyces sp. Ru87]PGH47446.1 aminotransferase [Streptomyces sp. Ru87]
MTGHHLLVHDGTFAGVNDCGDISGKRGPTPDGLFARDARHLSRWQLTVEASAPQVLVAAGQAGPDRPLAAVLTPPGSEEEPPAYTVFREQAVADRSLVERIRLASNRPGPVLARVALTVDADFADQFELRFDDRQYEKPGAVRSAVEKAGGVEFGYERVGSSAADRTWHARTVVGSQPVPDAVTRLGEGTARTLEWQVRLPPHGEAEVVVQASALPSGEAAAPPALRTPAAAVARIARENAAFSAAAPRPRDVIGWTELARSCEQGLADLAGLRAPAAGPDGEALRVPAAGIPWYLALFGRNSLFTSLFTLPYRPELAAATLAALAATQGGSYDPDRQEQPGRIVHEVRHGELSRFRQVPYGRFYGAVDSTPLFLTLLHAYTEETSDPALAVALEKQARSAVEWLFGDGGLSDRGWLACGPESAAGRGPAGQGWKDSPGALCFGDGVRPQGAVAVAEAQGYAYDALLRTARLARSVWDDAPFARSLEEAAGALRERFHQAFWVEEAGFPAQALDGAGNRAEALGSEAGHLLWSGILDQERGTAVGRRLLEADFFTGWGIRTLAAGQAPYHPLSYHRGSVRPHDNAVIVLGLARYGLTEQVLEATRGLVDAAAAHGWRLPEAMAGYARGDQPAPVPYPHSRRPHAWAAAAPLALLTAVKGQVR